MQGTRHHVPGLLPHFVLALLVCAALAVGPGPSARAADPISEEEAHSIGVAAYLYFYPLVTMDITRRQLTNVARPEGIHTQMNSFAASENSHRRI